MTKPRYSYRPKMSDEQRELSKEIARKRIRLWQLQNPERVREKCKKYYYRHREQILAKHKQNREKKKHDRAREKTV